MLREKMEELHSMAATSDIVDPFASESGDEDEENEIIIDAGEDIIFDVNVETDEGSVITED